MKRTIIVVLSLCLLSCHWNYRRPIKTGLEGTELPSFNILLSDSTTRINTASIPEGKSIVMLFFSPQCPYCRAEMASIMKNIGTMGGIRFYIFTNFPFEQFKTFAEHYQFDKYANIVAGQDYTNFFMQHFKPSGIPYTAIYTKDKKLNQAFMGLIPADQIKSVAENE